MDLTEIDRLSECSQDHDLKTAQKEISELKELLKCLRSCKQSKPVQVQIWNTERQLDAVTRSKSVDDQIANWTKHVQEAQEDHIAAQEQLRQARSRFEASQDVVTSAQLQLSTLEETKVGSGSETVGALRVLAVVGGGLHSTQSHLLCLSLDKQTRCLENVLVVALHAPGLSVPLGVLQNLAARQGFGHRPFLLRKFLCVKNRHHVGHSQRTLPSIFVRQGCGNAPSRGRQRCRYGVARCGRQGQGSSGRRVHERFETVVPPLSCLVSCRHLEDGQIWFTFSKRGLSRCRITPRLFENSAFLAWRLVAMKHAGLKFNFVGAHWHCVVGSVACAVHLSSSSAEAWATTTLSPQFVTHSGTQQYLVCWVNFCLQLPAHFVSTPILGGATSRLMKEIRGMTWLTR